MRAHLSLLAMLALAGCAARPLSFACPRLAEFRYEVGDEGSTGNTPRAKGPLMSAMLGALDRATVEQTPTTKPRTILVLSGGGPWGAFGAGFLGGWSESVAHPRPVFDLVTGVSTGALQATDAFLGRQADGALANAYTIARESELIDRRGLAIGAAAGSFAGTRPLEARVRAALAPVYDRLAAEAGKGRLLLVGTVDALNGRLYAIDLTKIARELSGVERADCYVGALMASAAVPVEFDRVELGGRPYFDGGVRRSVFVTDIQAAAAEAMDAMGSPSRLYILVNGDPATAPVQQLALGLVPTLARLRTLAVNEIEMSSIAAVARAAPPGFETYIASAQGNACGPDDAGHDAVFDPAFMRCLIADGHARWRSGVGDPWTRYASGTSRPENRVPSAAATPSAAPTPATVPGQPPASNTMPSAAVPTTPPAK